MGKKVLALDIGNVCVKINHLNFQQALGIKQLPEKLTILMRDFECGIIRDETTFLLTATRILENRFPAEQIRTAFNSILIEKVPGMTELVSALPRQGINAVFFSDISPTHLQRTKELFPAFDTVHGGIFSFESGAQKPSPAMFERFEQLYGVPDLYTDDRIDLITAAIRRGWNAVQFTNAEDLREKLSALS